MRRLALAAGLWSVAACAHAQAVTIQGFVEARVVVPAEETGWLDGGLGKTRFGGGGDVTGRAGGGLALAWQATPSLLAASSVHYVRDMRKPVDIVDAWVRYRPVSTTPTRWSLTAGMFFPPVSFENDGVAWTSPWTLTPSAINSWVGEELRTFGAELRMERRTSRGTLDLRGALFGRNDPAGELLSSRGWAMGDLTSGFDAAVRQPDAYARALSDPVPMRFRPFVEIDHRAGWYGSVGWDDDVHRARLLYYDNRTDPGRDVVYAGRELYGWHTRFWSAAAARRGGRWSWMAQAMSGSTRIAPEDLGVFDTRFNAGYVLAALDLGAWQPVARVDLFQTFQRYNGERGFLAEHGHATTLALNWRPHERVRVTGECLRIDSARNQRRAQGAPPRQAGIQWQLALRWFY